MPPHVAPTTAMPLPAVPVDATRPPLSAAALANLRAEILLRLIETMLRHLPRDPQAAAGRDLIETLFTALKSLPARDSAGGKRLQTLLSRLPPEVRPVVEKLIGNALSALPTRDLVTILRNPDTANARRLANLLATKLTNESETPTAGPRRTPVLTAQQIVAVARRGETPLPLSGDARALQSALRSIFEPDSLRPALPADTGRAQAAPAATVKEAATVRPAPRADTAATPEAETAAEEDAAPSVAQAVARKAPVEVLARAIVRLLANLSEAEALVVRTLLDRPLDLAPASGRTIATPALSRPEEGTQEAATTTAKDEAEAGAKPAEGAPLRKETVPTDLRRAAVPGEAARAGVQPPPEAHAATAAAAETVAATPLAVLREAVPLAFVPYLAVEDDLGADEVHEDEATDEDASGDEGKESPAQDEEDEAAEPEPEDTARRDRIDALVGGGSGMDFTRPQPGEYWT